MTKPELVTFFTQIFQGQRSVTTEDRAGLSASSSEDIRDAMTEVITSSRSAGMTSALTGVISVTVGSYPVAKAAAASADSTTLTPMLTAFAEAFEAEDDNHGPLAYAALFAALKHHRINTP
jgi:hypothetical protein